MRVILAIKSIADLLTMSPYRWCDIRCDFSALPAAIVVLGNRDDRMGLATPSSQLLS